MTNSISDAKLSLAANVRARWGEPSDIVQVYLNGSPYNGWKNTALLIMLCRKSGEWDVMCTLPSGRELIAVEWDNPWHPNRSGPGVWGPASRPARDILKSAVTILRELVILNTSTVNIAMCVYDPHTDSIPAWWDLQTGGVVTFDQLSDPDGD